MTFDWEKEFWVANGALIEVKDERDSAVRERNEAMRSRDEARAEVERLNTNKVQLGIAYNALDNECDRLKLALRTIAGRKCQSPFACAQTVDWECSACVAQSVLGDP